MLGNSLEFMVKKGAGPIDLDEGVPLDSSADTIAFFLDLLKLASFKQVLRNHIFTGVATTLDYEYSVYRVDEIGCKLSKRKERLRPNQLVYYKDVVSEKEVPNSHLASSETETVVDILNPQRVLDFIRRDVT